MYPRTPPSDDPQDDESDFGIPADDTPFFITIHAFLTYWSNPKAPRGFTNAIDVFD